MRGGGGGEQEDRVCCGHTNHRQQIEWRAVMEVGNVHLLRVLDRHAFVVKLRNGVTHFAAQNLTSKLDRFAWLYEWLATKK